MEGAVMARMLYADRRHAGRVLAQAAAEAGYAHQPTLLVLALPRGGVPVAAEVAKALRAPLDVLVVRKLGVPGHEEAAMGAIASGGLRWLNTSLVRRLGLSQDEVDAITQRELRELHEREQKYRGSRPRTELAGATVLLVDDGLATGSTMRVAVEAVRRQKPARVVVAVPVAPSDTVRALEKLADEVICPATPEPFQAVGQWYEDFTQVSDEEVRSLLG